jgi:CheY-like chemotaxis protein
MDESGAILLVEDNEDDVFLMQRALKKAGIANPLQVARDGLAAIRYLSGEGSFAKRDLYPLPKVIFLDLKLPHLDGFEVLKWIRQQPVLDPVAVVVLSSSGEPRDRQQATELGVRSYLVKPPAVDKLQALLLGI